MNPKKGKKFIFIVSSLFFSSNFFIFVRDGLKKSSISLSSFVNNISKFLELFLYNSSTDILFLLLISLMSSSMSISPDLFLSFFVANNSFFKFGSF